jgi:hypothetical protein
VPDPLPLVEGLLAATARIHDLTLATRHVKDVARTGVALVNPIHSSLTPCSRLASLLVPQGPQGIDAGGAVGG